MQRQARRLKSELYALYLAYKDPRVPWYARVLVACIVGYAFSPLDLIPDFIPILGYLDDLILVPAGIMLAIRLIPPEVLSECRRKAQEQLTSGKPVSKIAAGAIITIWILLAATAIWFFIHMRLFPA